MRIIYKPPIEILYELTHMCAVARMEVFQNDLINNNDRLNLLHMYLSQETFFMNVVIGFTPVIIPMLNSADFYRIKRKLSLRLNIKH